MKRPRFVETVPSDDPYIIKHPEDGHHGTVVDDHDRPAWKEPKKPKEAPEGILPGRFDQD